MTQPDRWQRIQGKYQELTKLAASNKLRKRRWQEQAKRYDVVERQLRMELIEYLRALNEGRTSA